MTAGTRPKKSPHYGDGSSWEESPGRAVTSAFIIKGGHVVIIPEAIPPRNFHGTFFGSASATFGGVSRSSLWVNWVVFSQSRLIWEAGAT